MELVLISLLLLLLVVLQIFDIISTDKALNLGAIETNPVVKIFMNVFGKYWWIPKVILLLPLFIISFIEPSYLIMALLIGINLFYTIIVYNNLKVISQLKKRLG